MILLVVTKLDLEDRREVNFEDVKQFIKRFSIKYWIETSAKQGINVDKLFIDASKFMLVRFGENIPSSMRQF